MLYLGFLFLTTSYSQPFIRDLMAQDERFLQDTITFYIDKDHNTCDTEGRAEPCILRMTLTNTDSDP